MLGKDFIGWKLIFFYVFEERKTKIFISWRKQKINSMKKIFFISSYIDLCVCIGKIFPRGWYFKKKKKRFFIFILLSKQVCPSF